MIRLAQIGLGYWGRNLLRNFAECEGVELPLLCDRDANARRQLARRFRNTAFCNEGAAVAMRDDIDALVIATPAQSHHELALTALRTGKHVFVEKPLALSVVEAQELVEAAHEQRRVLMVGHTFLYNAAVQQIKAYLQERLAGEVYYIYGRRLNLGIVRQDLDALWNFAPHDLSILLSWLGVMPVSVSARGYSYLQPGIADVVFLHLRFPSEVSAHLHLSWLDPGKVRQMTIVGSEKMIVYDDVHPDHKVQIFDKGITRQNLSASLGEFDSFGKFQLIQRAGDLVIPKIDFIEPLKVQCQHFIDCIRAGRRPLTDGEHGLQVVRLLAAAQQSMQQDGITISLSRTET